MTDNEYTDKTPLLYANVRRLVSARGILDDAMNALMEFKEELPQLAKLEKDVRDAKSIVIDLEVEIRELAIDLFNLNGNKKPHPAIPIKEYTILEYFEEAAIEWAKENAPIMVKEVLDKKLFEQFMKNAADPPSFVVRKVEPRTNLTAEIMQHGDTFPEETEATPF